MSNPANWDPDVSQQLALGVGAGSAISGDVGGALPGPTTVTGIQGVPVSPTPPTIGQELVFDGAQWAPATEAPGGLSSVTDGTTTVSPATSIDFTSGAVVTNLGGGVAGVAIAPSMAPYYIAPGDTFTVPLYYQALWTVPIDNEGTLVVDGYLAEVS